MKLEVIRDDQVIQGGCYESGKCQGEAPNLKSLKSAGGQQQGPGPPKSNCSAPAPGCKQVSHSPPCPPHLQPTDDFPERKSRFISTDESGCGQVEDLVEVRFIQPIKAFRIFHGWDKRKQEREGRKRDGGTPSRRDQVHLGEVGKGQKKSSIKPKISMKEVYMDKNKAVIKQKDIKHGTTRLQKVTQETKHKAIYIRM